MLKLMECVRLHKLWIICVLREIRGFEFGFQAHSLGGTRTSRTNCVSNSTRKKTISAASCGELRDIRNSSAAREIVAEV